MDYSSGSAGNDDLRLRAQARSGRKSKQVAILHAGCAAVLSNADRFLP